MSNAEQMRLIRAQYDHIFEAYKKQLLAKNVDIVVAHDAAFVLAYVPVGSRTRDQQFTIDECLHQLLPGVLAVAPDVEGAIDE